MNFDHIHEESKEEPTKKREVKAIEQTQTLYLNNLNEKIKKEEMQHSLFHLFSLYGDILEITVKRNLKMKGQAFVVFSNPDSAAKAMHDLQNYLFFDKKINIQYSKNISDITCPELHQKQGAILINSLLNKRFQKRRQEEVKDREFKRKMMQEQLTEIKEDISHMQDKIEQKREDEKKHLLDSTKTILVVENLPSEANTDLLNHVFNKYPGLVSININATKCVGFVEFSSHDEAKLAQQRLNGFPLTEENKLIISFK